MELKEVLEILNDNQRAKEIEILGKKLIILPKVFDPNFIADKTKKITAVDISEYALENTKRNICLHKLENKIEIKKSDLFSNISEKFDLIIFNPPFFSEKPRNVLEIAVTNYQNNLLVRFFKEVRDYLNKKT